MSFPIGTVTAAEFPPLLREIPQPPETLYYRGVLPPANMKLLAVVGSRKFTSYGQQVVERLISGLSNYPVGIVSGLALGIDTLAHKAALNNNLYTLAIPGSGLNDSVIYPASNRRLAKEILSASGGLMSELPPTATAAPWTFPARNRIMAGLSHATLLIEAAEKSGTLITARMATDYNRELLVVPGSIFSTNSKGVHQFLKLGATPVTEASDILYALGIDPEKNQDEHKRAAVDFSSFSPAEQHILSLLNEPTDADTLIRLSKLPTHEANIILMQMEMRGLIANQNGRYYTII